MGGDDKMEQWPTRHQSAPGCLWGPCGFICPNSASINSLKSWNQQGSPWNTFSAAASSRTMRSHLEAFSGTLPEGDSIPDGLYIILVALPWCVSSLPWTYGSIVSSLKASSSLFNLQYNVLLDILGDLFDVMTFCGVFVGIRWIASLWSDLSMNIIWVISKLFYAWLL